jgi:hypothetical protein
MVLSRRARWHGRPAHACGPGAWSAVRAARSCSVRSVGWRGPRAVPRSPGAGWRRRSGTRPAGPSPAGRGSSASGGEERDGGGSGVDGDGEQAAGGRAWSHARALHERDSIGAPQAREGRWPSATGRGGRFCLLTVNLPRSWSSIMVRPADGCALAAARVVRRPRPARAVGEGGRPRRALLAPSSHTPRSLRPRRRSQRRADALRAHTTRTSGCAAQKGRPNSTVQFFPCWRGLLHAPPRPAGRWESSVDKCLVRLTAAALRQAALGGAVAFSASECAAAVD